MLSTLAFSGIAACETLGDARQLSRVGEPLRISIPIRADGGPALNERCLAVAAPTQSDGLPHILTANVAIERDASSAAVTVTTAVPMREPVVRILLRTTCDGGSRQYTLFLEPAGSTRQIRAVAQPGPPVGPVSRGASGAAPPVSAARGSVPVSDSEAPRPPASPPAVTVIPVVPAPVRRAEAEPRAAPAAPNPTPLIAAASPGAAMRPSETPPTPDPAGSTTAAPAQSAAVLEAENETLKQQIATLTGELQRLQQSPAAAAKPPPSTRGTVDAPNSPRWEWVWPVLVALAGLAALTTGGFMWRRRHQSGEEWVLTGPPSHRLASRTSLAEQPVPFKQVGVRTDLRPEETPVTIAGIALATPRDPAAPPASLRLQPSADDLARELEQELFIAEHAHSALERAHPDIVDTLTRSWGTAAARNHLLKLLDGASPELSRMSGEAVAELRMLLRMAEDPNPREDIEVAAHTTLSPPAPAW